MDRDDEKILRVTNKELFYSAMLLGFDRVVGVEYFFPTDEKALTAEVEEAKRTLHKKRLLKENSKGEISLDGGLTKCLGLCSHPEKCTVVDSGGVYAIIYETGGENLILERINGTENAARFFDDRAAAEEYARGVLRQEEEIRDVHS